MASSKTAKKAVPSPRKPAQRPTTVPAPRKPYVASAYAARKPIAPSVEITLSGAEAQLIHQAVLNLLLDPDLWGRGKTYTGHQRRAAVRIADKLAGVI